MNPASKIASSENITKNSEWRVVLRSFPIVRSFGQTSPSYHTGSILENQLGLQVARTIGKRIVRSFRRTTTRSEIKAYRNILERDGVLVLEDFLPEEQFKLVVDEFESANKVVPLTAYKRVANAKLFRTQLDVDNSPESFLRIRENFQKNCRLDEIASAVLRRPVTRMPDVLLDTYQNPGGTGIDNDIENILHADLHTPTVKMFFYLNRVDEKNGAFVYAKGSHKLTFARLIHEYDLSVREAKLKEGKVVPEALLERRGAEVRNVIKPEHFEKMKLEETQICVEPNTLVIANNMGFHRRGEFQSTNPRKSLLVNYRKAERLFF